MAIVAGGVLVTSSVGCSEPPPDGGGTPAGVVISETSAASTIDATRPVSLRFINIAASCTPLTLSGIATAINLTNGVFQDSGLSFRFYSYESYPLPPGTRTRDVKGNKVTWDEISELWQGLGISCPSCSTEGEKEIELWLFRISQNYLKRQYVMWLGCGSGGVAPLYYPTAFTRPAASAPHEIGHSFGLPHTFELVNPASPPPGGWCTFWDLVYSPRGSGINNVYFSSRFDCILKMGGPNAPPNPIFYKIDPRDRDDGPDNESNGMPRLTSNRIVTVHNPRCAGCTTDWGVPSPGVEEYSTGAPQIKGYARFNSSGQGAINTDTYCSAPGCPSASTLGAEFLSASQIEVVQSTVANNPWVQSDQTCSTGINGGSVCCAASCGSCGGPGCDTRPGGAAACCSSSILAAGFSCTQTAPPCIISDPRCITGIDGGGICCAASCGSCGGAGCETRPGGAAACCSGSIVKAARSCSTNMPPCVMP